MNDIITNLKNDFSAQLAEITDPMELEKVRVAYLGKKGSITALLKGMKDLSPEERKTFGAEVNVLKTFATEEIDAKAEQLKKLEAV